MGTFPDSIGMTSYTMAILFSALKPIVKMLSIEIVIFHTLQLIKQKYIKTRYVRSPQTASIPGPCAPTLHPRTTTLGNNTKGLLYIISLISIVENKY
jgi:hypothetical protein